MFRREILSVIKVLDTSYETNLAEFEDTSGLRALIPVKVYWQGRLEHICITYARVVRGAIPGPVLEFPNSTLFWQSPEGLPWEQKPGKNAQYANMRLVELASG